MDSSWKTLSFLGKQILRMFVLAVVVWIICGQFIFVTMIKFFDVGPTWKSQRPLQRQKVQQRIAAIGGWKILRHVAEKFCTDYPGRVDWNYRIGDRAEIPKAFAALSPMRVSINAHPEIVYPVNGRVVELHFFGSHSTGSHGIPDYDIWVVCGKAPGYVPDLSHFRGSMNEGVANRIQEGIFEVY